MNRAVFRHPASLDRRGLLLATPLLAGVLPSCAGAILARGRGSESKRLLAREVAALDARGTPTARA